MARAPCVHRVGYEYKAKILGKDTKPSWFQEGKGKKESYSQKGAGLKKNQDA